MQPGRWSPEKRWFCDSFYNVMRWIPAAMCSAVAMDKYSLWQSSRCIKPLSAFSQSCGSVDGLTNSCGSSLKISRAPWLTLPRITARPPNYALLYPKYPRVRTIRPLSRGPWGGPGNARASFELEKKDPKPKQADRNRF